MASLKFVDEYVIQKGVAADNTYESDVAHLTVIIILNQVITQALMIFILTMKHCQI